jgi:hypothetical protein
MTAILCPDRKRYVISEGIVRSEIPLSRGGQFVRKSPTGPGRTRAFAASGGTGEGIAANPGAGAPALLTDVDNAASQRVAGHAGFTREGILRAYEERKCERHDVVAYSLVPADLG